MGKLQNPYKIVFFGTSEFAIPALEKLHESDFDVVAVVTQPDRPAGRRQEPLPSPIKVEAEKLGLKILQPPLLSSPTSGEELKEGGSPDLFIVASYGKILPKEILQIPKFGALNIHPSLLPKYRGPSPIHAAILNGDEETGVTIIKMDEEIDHGEVVAVKQIAISDQRIEFKTLHDRLAELGAQLLIEILPRYIAGEITPVPQDHSKATFTKIIAKEDARIDWRKSAEEIDRQVRAFEEWPVAWTKLDSRRLKIFDAEVFLESQANKILGEVVRVKTDLVVACGAHMLKLNLVQLEGKKKMPAFDFLKGQPSLAGKFLS